MKKIFPLTTQVLLNPYFEEAKQISFSENQEVLANDGWSDTPRLIAQKCLVCHPRPDPHFHGDGSILDSRIRGNDRLSTHKCLGNFTPIGLNIGRF